MIQILLLLLFAMGTAYIASQNSMAVELTLLQYSAKNIPLYIVIIGSIATGFLVGFVINLITKFMLYRKINYKNKELEKSRTHILELTRRIHKLELLQEDTKEISDEKSL